MSDVFGPDQTSPSALLPGRVVEHRGKSLTVEDASGQRTPCRIRTKLGEAAVGDQVLWCRTGQQEGRVEQLLPRRSLLSRPARRGQTRPVAANLDQLVALIAPRPSPDLLLLDQYLVIAEYNAISVLIVLNKSDLPEAEALRDQLRPYQQLGYEVIEISAKFETGLAQLQRQLSNRCSILLGQSGVGKTTLTNRLLPEANLRTQSVSDQTGHGRHTTTATSMYALPHGGEIIDSPGVNVFGLADIDCHKLAAGFREFAAVSDQCRFHNCQHLSEPGCAVTRQTKSGEITVDRYNRYLKLRDKLPVSD